jgi:hypothetical protein
LGYVYISFIYLCLLIGSSIVALNGYPIALVIFGLVGMVLSGYGLLQEKQGKSSFFRTFVSQCTKYSKESDTYKTPNYEFHIISDNKLRPCFIRKICDWFVIGIDANQSQNTQEERNCADSKQDTQEFPHSQPPEDEK